MGGPPAWGFGEVLTPPHLKKKYSFLRNVTQGLRFGRIIWNACGSGQRPLADLCKHGYEPSSTIKGGKFLD
jgi:hypothetical protein